MNKKIIETIKRIEGNFKFNFPQFYKKFLLEEIIDKEVYEILNKRGEAVYLYNCFDLEERNKTYMIQNDVPDYFMIGQDGDIGYFINMKNESEIIYSLDLGALGTDEMQEESKNIYLLTNK